GGCSLLPERTQPPQHPYIPTMRYVIVVGLLPSPEGHPPFILTAKEPSPWQLTPRARTLPASSTRIPAALLSCSTCCASPQKAEPPTRSTLGGHARSSTSTGLNWSTPATALLPWSLRKDKRGTRCCSSATPAGKHSSVLLRTPEISRSQGSALRLGGQPCAHRPPRPPPVPAAGTGRPHATRGTGLPAAHQKTRRMSLSHGWQHRGREIRVLLLRASATIQVRRRER